MALPETIAVRYTKESAAYLAMAPVVSQIFQIRELLDMVVRVAGKDAARVGKILSAGAITYDGYRYFWEGFATKSQELAALLAVFPDDDPSRSFDPDCACAVILEIGGGTERVLVEISRKQAEAKRWFSKCSAWDVLISCTKDFAPRYDGYDYERRGDRFRITLRYEAAQRLVVDMLAEAPRRLRFALRNLRPPASLTYIAARASATLTS